MVSAAVTSRPPNGRDTITEPHRMHSAELPGLSGSTRWLSPQVSQA